MGLFSRFADLMNQEFVIGERNVRRYTEDPASLDDILTEQHARGFGSVRGLRESSRAQAAAKEGSLIAYRPSAGTARARVQLRAKQRTGLLERVGQAYMVVGLGLIAAHLWKDLRDD